MKEWKNAQRITSYVISRMAYFYNRLRWKKPARPNKIIWIYPDNIERSIEFSRLVKKKRYNLDGIISNGDWDKNRTSINKSYKRLFKAFEQHFLEGVSFGDTDYFVNSRWNKKETDRRREMYTRYYGRMFKEISENGFKIRKSIFDKVDDFKVSIASNGDILFMTGKHRLAIAKLMGDDFRIPVKVSYRHKKWQEYRDKLYSEYRKGNKTKEEIRNLNHPDLLDLIEE